MKLQTIIVDTVYFGGSVAIYANGKLHGYRKQLNTDHAMLYIDLLNLSKHGIIQEGIAFLVNSEAVFWCTKYGKNYGQDEWLPPVFIENITDHLQEEHSKNDCCPYCS